MAVPWNSSLTFTSAPDATHTLDIGSNYGYIDPRDASVYYQELSNFVNNQTLFGAQGIGDDFWRTVPVGGTFTTNNKTGMEYTWSKSSSGYPILVSTKEVPVVTTPQSLPEYMQTPNPNYSTPTYNTPYTPTPITTPEQLISSVIYSPEAESPYTPPSQTTTTPPSTTVTDTTPTTTPTPTPTSGITPTGTQYFTTGSPAAYGYQWSDYYGGWYNPSATTTPTLVAAADAVAWNAFKPTGTTDATQNAQGLTWRSLPISELEQTGQWWNAGVAGASPTAGSNAGYTLNQPRYSYELFQPSAQLWNRYLPSEQSAYKSAVQSTGTNWDDMWSTLQKKWGAMTPSTSQGRFNWTPVGYNK